MPWTQVYNPLGSPALSTLAAALPIVVLFGLIATHRVRAPVAALAGLATALAIAVAVIGMPAGLALRSAAYGAAYGVFPISWIVLHVIFLYQLAEGRGSFDVLRRLISGLTEDRRLQLVLIAFAFGAFFEGAAGFGTPVAVTGAILIGLGFAPFEASALSLIANTAPVAFGALGTPIIALQGVTKLDLHDLSAMIGRQLPVFSVIIPVWLVWAYAGLRGVRDVLPALLVAGVAFAVPQYLVSNYHGPWLVDVVASVCSMAATVAFLRVWRPAGRTAARAAAGAPLRTGVLDAPTPRAAASAAQPPLRRGDVVRALLPWAVLSVVVFAWGTPQVRDALNAVSAPKIPVPGLDKLVLRAPPVVAKPSAEAAVFTCNWLSATGTAILLAALVTGRALGYAGGEMLRVYGRTLVLVRQSLLTIAAMLAIGYVSRYAGLDAVLGLAFARTGVLYPFFGAMLGWLGVALTGSDTSSNVLFGSLQTITARQVGVSQTLMAAANSSGGVMGKMVDAQSIVVASTATRWYGHEGRILRFVIGHSLALAALVGAVIMLEAYVAPFTRLVVR